jgi:hypothetical protein
VLAVEAEMMEVRAPDDFEGALKAARTRHTEAGTLLSSPLVFVSSKQISELALASPHFLVRRISKERRLIGLWAECK